MSPEVATPAFFPGQAYALVIGISNHKHGCVSGQELAPEQFTNLNFAAKDANDFADFLENYGFIQYNVRRLIDQSADLTGIKQEFEELRKRCRESADKDPLVIVFFAGHGMADVEHRHYLIPWDAQRNKLYATAFWNNHFSDCLNQLGTKKLVVFIDACHAGAIGLEAARGELPQYTPKELGAGSGRYVIGSCAEGQKSWEWETNGIFTGHLLQLLRCETDDLDEEEIDIFRLYPVLKAKVAKTALEKYQQEQEPTVNDIKEATGIILAINQKIRNRKAQEQDQNRQSRCVFRDYVCDTINRRGKILVIGKLNDYIDLNIRYNGFTVFYDSFEALFQLYLTRWRDQSDWPVEDVCTQLINLHERALAPPVSAATPGRNEAPSREARAATTVAATSEEKSRAQEPSKPVDRLEGEAQTAILGVERPVIMKPINDAVGRQRLFKQLSEDDIDYVTRDLLRLLRYFTETRDLKRFLAKPVTVGEFSIELHSLLDKKRDDKTFEDLILRGVLTRFEERWDNANVVESQNLASLMTERR